MKLGVSVGYWGLGLTAADQLDIAQTAEALGYDSIWTAEAYGSDAATVLAGLGPENVALAGEIADGWLPVFFSPEHTQTLRGPLEEGAARAGRSLDQFRICPSVNVMISDDVESARNAMRPLLALYVGGMGSREQNFYNRLVSSYGFERAAEQVQELYLAGKKTEAMFALPDELIDLVSIVGPPDRAKAKIREFHDAGVDTLISLPVLPDHEQRKEQLRLIAELADKVG